MNILLVEDEARVADFILRGLTSEGWVVDAVDNGEAALGLLDSHEFDVVVLDHLLPGLSGRDVCRRMRARQDHTPVLMLTALGQAGDRVQGLRAGADDYLAKPFDFDELVARLEALKRRASQFAYKSTSARAAPKGDIRFDRQAMTFSCSGAAIKLTSTERRLLQLFLSNPARALSRERILNAVWGASEDPMTNVVDVYVGRLRKKLNVSKARIRSIRGIGYRYDPS